MMLLEFFLEWWLYLELCFEVAIEALSFTSSLFFIVSLALKVS